MFNQQPRYRLIAGVYTIGSLGHNMLAMWHLSRQRQNHIIRKRDDYACVKGKYQSILQNIKHYLRRENKV